MRQVSELGCLGQVENAYLKFSWIDRMGSETKTSSRCPLLDPARLSAFKASNLLGGALQILLGLLVGFIPPGAIAWYAMLVKTHALSMANGCLCIILSLLVPDLVGSMSAAQLRVWALTLQLGTFLNPAAHFVAAITGTKSHLVRTMGPAPHGDSDIVTFMLYTCAVNILIATALTVYGLWKKALC
jgi:hypothetical protein